MSDDRKAKRDVGTPELRGQLAWGLVRAALLRGEDPRPALLTVIRTPGCALPDDKDERAWIADVLDGKHLPKRGRGPTP